MDYKLAEKLKDAGFPQHLGELQGCQNECDREVCVPTLSELIDECRKLKPEGTFSTTVRDGYAEARMYYDDPHCNAHYMSWNGEDLEEAVSNLYLELNK